MHFMCHFMCHMLIIMYKTNYIFCCWYNLMGEKCRFQKDLMQYQNQRNIYEHDESSLCELLSVFELLLDFLFTLCKNYSSSIQINVVDL